VLPSALPAPSTPRIGRARPPSGPTQTLLARVWQEALGLREIGRDDDFFTLGGDSLAAIKIAALSREVGLRFEPADVLRYPTLVELASRIDARMEAAREGIESASLEAPCSLA
jgi:mycobactin peptide synthetase MbtE